MNGIVNHFGKPYTQHNILKAAKISFGTYDICKTTNKKVQPMSFSKYTFQIKKNINNLARQKTANDKLFF